MNPMGAIAGTVDPNEQDRQTAQSSMLGQLAMLALAAGQRQTSGQRAATIAGAAPVIGGYQQGVLSAAQARLMQSKATQDQEEQQRQAAMQGKLSDPAFVQGLGLTPEQAQLLGPQAAIDALKARAAHDPTDVAYKQALLQKLTNPSWETTGYDEFGKPTRDLVAPNGRILTPGGAKANTPPITEQLKGLQGMDVINKLKETDPGLAAQVDAIASGRQPFPQSIMRTPRGEVISDLVSMVDPNYTAATYGARKKMMEGAANSTLGSIGGQTTFGNTAIKHLGHLYDMVDELGNWNTGLPGNKLANALKNKIADSRGQASSIVKWDSTATNAADEIAKFYGAGGVTEREKLKALFDASRSPDELRSVIKEAIDDIHAKTSNLQNQWGEVMGPYAGSKKFIYDDTQKIVDKILNGKTQDEAPAAPSIPGVRAIRQIN